ARLARPCIPSASRPRCASRSAITLGEYNFAGQYQQMLAPQGGGMVKAAWFPDLRAERAARPLRPRRAELGHRQQGDRAQRFQRVHELGIAGKDLYLLHVLRLRMEYRELKRAVLEQAAAFNANVVLIEDKASGTKRLGLLRW